MIEFVLGPNNEMITASEKTFVTKMLNTCLEVGSLSHQVNFAYNNVYHFYNPQYQYDIMYFLKELKNMVDSVHHKVQVMGSIHEDPFGHTSNLVGQYSGYGDYIPSIVKDRYIRFKVKMDPKNRKILRTLDETNVFHFLVDVPEIVKLQLPVSHPITMRPLINSDGNLLEYPSLYPKSKYKKSKLVIYA